MWADSVALECNNFAPNVALYGNKTIVCIAGGASLTADDAAYCEGRADVLAINRSFEVAPFARWLYACDGDFWRTYLHALTFHGEKWTQDKPAAQKYGLHYVESRPGTTLGTSFVGWGQTAENGGGNSGFQALNLALHFGATRVLLLGYDMGGKHWHEDHTGHCANPLPHNFDAWIRGFEAAVPQLERLGVEVINCSRRTRLHCFRRAPIDKVL